MLCSAADSLLDCRSQRFLMPNLNRLKPRHNIASPLLSALLLGCQVQFVSPYSADVQKRASDMISEVSAWELQMRETAGTPDADPRQPNIRAQFAKWDGELEAMAAVETALNPEIINCDRLAAAVARSSKVRIPNKRRRDLRQRLPACAGYPHGLSLSFLRCMSRRSKPGREACRYSTFGTARFITSCTEAAFR